MELRLLLHVKFNRPVDLEKDYIVVGGFEMVMNGKNVQFDFHNQYHNLIAQSPQEDIITLYNPDYSEFPGFKDITVDDLKMVSKIKECFVYLGKPGETDLEVESVKNIYFTVINDKYEAIAVDSKIIDDFNLETEKTKNIIRAAFTSVWDNTVVTTPCKVNTVTKEVFDIEQSSVELIGSCNDEYITLHGQNYPVHGEHNLTNTEDEYWYDAEPAQFVRLDRMDRPVYELSAGRFIKDVELRPQFEPSLHYSCNNDIDGEPDCPVEKVIKLLPKRVTR